MSKRPSVAMAVRRNLEEAEAAPAAAPIVLAAPPVPPPAVAAAPAKASASTRADKKFITFPVNPPAKKQFDIMAVELGMTREDMAREALRDFFVKHGRPPLD